MVVGEKSGLRINSKGGIVGVNPGTIAQKVGLQVGDTVLAVDGNAVDNDDVTHSAVQLWAAGKELVVRVLRVHRGQAAPDAGNAPPPPAAEVAPVTGVAAATKAPPAPPAQLQQLEFRLEVVEGA
eukprot:5210960-Prymnesium_polylepis.1